MTVASTTQLVCFVILSSTLVLGSLAVVLLPNIVYSAFLLAGVFLSVAGLYLLLNASFVAAAQVLVYVGAVNVLILFAIMLVNKKENMAPIPGMALRRFLSGAVCAGLLGLLIRVAFTTPWALPGPTPVGEDATIRIGEHLFSDYLLPFELASVLLLMAMIGAIVLARRDVFSSDIITGEPADQVLIEKERSPMLLEPTDSVPLRSSTMTADAIPLQAFLTVAAFLFCIGVWGLINSRNAVRVLMSIELMLNAVNLNLMAFSNYLDGQLVRGQVFAIFVITVAAAEAAVGLAILLSLYRNRETVDMERFNLLRW
jgi:NAD(P)H-quinone oxidoreductase subunit 6